jgi:hypothetical protein
MYGSATSETSIADWTRVWAALPLERVLEGERVEKRREHPRVVRCRPVHSFRSSSHAAVDVPGADDDRELDSLLLYLDDLPGDRVDPLPVEPVLLVAHQRLP